MPASGRCEIRTGSADDAEAISAVIVAALRETNAADYPPAVIERLAHAFRPDGVQALMARRLCLVAVLDGRIAGTASLEESAVRSVFVDPAVRRAGHARALLAGVATALAACGRDGVLDVVESVPAERLYRAAGWVRTGAAPAGWRFPDGREPVAALYRLPITQRRTGDDAVQ